MFGTYDLAAFLGYMATVMVIGFAVGRREKATVGDYFRAGNRLPWYAIGASIIAAGISSEQFVGEIGYAYKLGMPVVNWEWLIFPALSLLLWIFVPLYIRAIREANPMGKATLGKVLEVVRTLAPDELGKLRDEIDAMLAAPKSPSVEEAVELLLFERGVVSEIKPRALDPARYRDRKPVAVKGKPISEVIIEERR